MVQVFPLHRGASLHASEVVIRQARGEQFITENYTVQYVPGRPYENITDEELARLAISQLEAKKGGGIASTEKLDFSCPAWQGEFLGD